MTETFFMVAVLWSLERALALAEASREETQPAWGAALGLGVSLGVATLLRQAILPWVPVLFLWLLLNVYTSSRRPLTPSPSHPIIRLFVSGLILLAFILPWTYRNYRVYGEFLLLELQQRLRHVLGAASHARDGLSSSTARRRCRRSCGARASTRRSGTGN